MIDKSKIIEAANYYLNNNVTLEEAGRKAGIKSKKTLDKYFNELLGKSTLQEDVELYRKIQEKKQLNVANGRKKGGQMGTRAPGWTEEDVRKLYDYVMNNLTTYRKIEDELGIPHATAFDMLHSSYLSEEEKSRLVRVGHLNKGERRVYSDDMTQQQLDNYIYRN